MREAFLRIPYNSHPMLSKWAVTDTAATCCQAMFIPGRPLAPADAFSCGAQVLAELPNRGGTLSAVIFNGVGTGYGDLICGSVFVRALYQRIESMGYKPEIGLIPMPQSNLAAYYKDIFGNDPHVAYIAMGGIAMEQFQKVNLVYSTEALIADGEFDKTDMIGYFLKRGGIDDFPDKNPELYPNVDEFMKEFEAVRSESKDAIYLNFFGSGMRRVPVRFWRDIADPLLRAGYRLRLNAEKGASGLVQSWVSACYSHKRDYISCVGEPGTWAQYCARVSACKGMVTTDTSATHVAAALRKPCVTMFAFIDPGLRICHYPLARGWTSEAFKMSKLWGKSHPPSDWTFFSHDDDPRICRPWQKSDKLSIVRLLQEVIN